MLTAEERKGLIEKIRSLPSLIEQTVSGLNEEQLNTPYRENGWTARQIIHHLADSHLNGVVRMKLILTEEKPPLKSYDQDEWARLPDIGRTSIEVSLTILRGLHERWCNLLNGLPDASWSRVGIQDDQSEATLDDLLGVYGRHGENHINQIRKLLAERGWPSKD